MTQTAENKPDLLLFFSDQHHGLYSGYAGHPEVRTPNLDRLAAEGAVCETAYTSCPLCVPARAGLLTGQLPSHNGVFNNGHSIASDQSTFLHALTAEGYETVLCGRMHFKGPDQRHGFARRICGDITSVFNGGIPDGGEFGNSYGMFGCVDLAGAGTSPVLDYDRAVVAAALDYLRQPHETPQCIVVGTYGPHFPYVAPPEWFELYRGQIAAPVSWDPEGADANPLVDAKRQRTRHAPADGGRESPVTTEVMLAARAAYLGMITEQDRHVGAVREAWQEHLKRSGRTGVFCYSSDHGDTCGEHGVFGKQTFYEGSVRIPMIFEGHGIHAGGSVRRAVSIMDIGPTFCELAGAELPPCPDGAGLAALLRGGGEAAERPVFAEWVQPFAGNTVAARMVRAGSWKLMHYRHDRIPDQLFDLENDPDELHNLADERPDVCGDLRRVLEHGWEPERCVAVFDEKQKHQRALHRADAALQLPEPEGEKWRVPAESGRLPGVIY